MPRPLEPASPVPGPLRRPGGQDARPEVVASLEAVPVRELSRAVVLGAFLFLEASEAPLGAKLGVPGAVNIGVVEQEVAEGVEVPADSLGGHAAPFVALTEMERPMAVAR